MKSGIRWTLRQILDPRGHGHHIIRRLAEEPFRGARFNSESVADLSRIWWPISPEYATGHEQLDELALVHMGGRVYDAPFQAESGGR